MTPYDAAMAGVIIAGMVWGAWRGITWQLASMASLVLGYLFAHPLSAQLASHFPGQPAVARALAMLAVYAAVSGGVFLVAWLIRATLRRLKFEAFDRHLGMVLGGLEGALLGLVATLFVTSLAPSTRGPIFGSPSGRVVGRVMDAVGPVLPTEIRSAVASSWAHAPAVAQAEEPKTRLRPLLKTGLLDRSDRRFDGTHEPEERPEADDRPGDARRDSDDVRGSANDEDIPADEPPPSAEDLRGKIGKAAGRIIEKEIGPGSKDPGDVRSKVVREAAGLLEQSIKKGDVSGPGLKGLLKEGRSRLGRAAGELLEREINRMGEADGQSQAPNP